MNAINRQTAPSGGQIQRALSAAGRMIEGLLADDPSIAEDETLLADTIEAQTNAIDVLERVVRFGLEAESMAAAVEARIHAMEQRRERFRTRGVWAREAAATMLEALNLSKHEAPDFTLTVSQGRRAVVITGEVPSCFTRIQREPDKAEIGKALKAGAEFDFATLSNAQPVLTIRTK